jgi:DNA-binding MarR family transcriptional regulator
LGELMTTLPAIADTDLAERLRLAVTRLARRLRQQSEVDASPTQLSALSTIEHRGPITLGELAAAERVQPPTITAAVGRLEIQGLVRRRTDENDRRVVWVEITGAGRKVQSRNRSRRAAYLAKRLRALTPEERATLSEATVILDRLLEPDEQAEVSARAAGTPAQGAGRRGEVERPGAMRRERERR